MRVVPLRLSLTFALHLLPMSGPIRIPTSGNVQPLTPMLRPMASRFLPSFMTRRFPALTLLRIGPALWICSQRLPAMACVLSSSRRPTGLLATLRRLRVSQDSGDHPDCRRIAERIPGRLPYCNLDPPDSRGRLAIRESDAGRQAAGGA